MSCDFDIWCMPCSTGTGFSDLNWGQDYLAPALRHRAELEAPGLHTDKDMWWFFDEGSRLSKVVRFFGEHVGHELVVISEYGQIYGHNNECNEGDTGKGFCGLGKGHVGRHEFLPTLRWNEAGKRLELP